MATLKYDFSIVGLNTVQRALSSLERRLARFNAKQQRMFGGGGSGGRGGLRQNIAARQAASLEAKRSMQRRRAGDREMSARANQIRKISLMERREATKTAAHRERLIQREAIIRIRANDRAARQGQRSLVAARKRRGRVIGGAVAGGIGGVGRTAVGMLAVGGGFLAADAIRNEIAIRRQAAGLAVQAYGTKGGQGRSLPQLQRDALTTAKAVGVPTGIGREQMLAGMAGFQEKAGRLDKAIEFAPQMADISLAFGADLNDVGVAAGTIFENLQKQGHNAVESFSMMETIIENIAAQSKTGSIEMKDMATQVGKLMAAASQFGGDQADVATMLGAIGQAAAPFNISPEATLTSLNRWVSDVIQGGAQTKGAFKQLGIDPKQIFDVRQIAGKESFTGLISPEKLMRVMTGATGGDITKIAGAFGQRGRRAFLPFAATYRRGALAEPDPEKQMAAGLKAVQDIFDEARELKPKKGEVKEAVSFITGTEANKIAANMERLRTEIGSRLLPVIGGLIDNLTVMIPNIVNASAAFAEVAAFAIENPFAGLGVLVGAKITASLASAGIGSMVGKLFAGELGPVVTGLAKHLGALSLVVASAYLLFEQASGLSKDFKDIRKDIGIPIKRQLAHAERRGSTVAMLEGMTPGERLAALPLALLGLAPDDDQMKRFIARGAGGEPVPFKQALEEEQDPVRRGKLIADMNRLLKEGSGDQKVAADALLGAAEKLSGAALDLQGASGAGGVNRSDVPAGAGGAGGAGGI